jgi:2-C-methyl-D-erythritol 4-phosphate cytidylyltransferase / 2-C-methyl-D-erythritol 2,4-cyclodiphosphate synthase
MKAKLHGQNLMSETLPVAALIVAGGSGQRLRAATGDSLPKQYRELAGVTVVARSLNVFLGHDDVDLVQPVIGMNDSADFKAATSHIADAARMLPPVPGGGTRQASVLAGLLALAKRGFSGTVLVHDAARPFVSADLISRAIASCGQASGAVPVLPVVDTIKHIGPDGIVAATLPRTSLVTVQTPQAFRFEDLLQAHQSAAAAEIDNFPDDAAVMEWAGMPVATFMGDAANLKLTHAEDFAAAERRLGMNLISRTGQGYDVHRFTTGDHVWLGGIRIDHERGVEAHSDGDVVLHALTDALLGALAEGDIGEHFKPSDERWRGASSDRFLAYAVARVAARSGRIVHLDVTVVCEEPKVGPHRDAMRARIGEICGLGVESVSIKATTSERMGFTGRREGLSASAVVTVLMPDEVRR